MWRSGKVQFLQKKLKEWMAPAASVMQPVSLRLYNPPPPSSYLASLNLKPLWSSVGANQISICPLLKTLSGQILHLATSVFLLLHGSRIMLKYFWFPTMTEKVIQATIPLKMTKISRSNIGSIFFKAPKRSQGIKQLAGQNWKESRD